MSQHDPEDNSIANELRNWAELTPPDHSRLDVNSLKCFERKRRRQTQIAGIGGAVCFGVCLLLATFLSNRMRQPQTIPPDRTELLAHQDPTEPSLDATKLAKEIQIVREQNELLQQELRQLQEELHLIRSRQNRPPVAQRLAAARREYYYEQALDEWLAKN